MSLIVVIRNLSGLADTSDYEYTVLVGDGTKAKSKKITGGRIVGHVRSRGWKALVQRVLDEEGRCIPTGRGRGLKTPLRGGSNPPTGTKTNWIEADKDFLCKIQAQVEAWLYRGKDPTDTLWEVAGILDKWSEPIDDNNK